MLRLLIRDSLQSLYSSFWGVLRAPSHNLQLVARKSSTLVHTRRQQGRSLLRRLPPTRRLLSPRSLDEIKHDEMRVGRVLRSVA